MNKRERLKKRFDDLHISYSQAAKEIGLSKTKLYDYLAGKRAGFGADTQNLIEAWVEGKETASTFQAKTPLRQLFKLGGGLEEAAQKINLNPAALQGCLRSGRWPSEEVYNRYQAYLETVRERRQKKMLTKISVPEDVLEHFGLKRDPFTNEMEEQEDIFDAKELNRAEKKIKNAIDRKGWVAVTGRVGSGKSTLLKKIKAYLDKRRDVQVIEPRTIEKQFLGASHVCDAILADLGTSALSKRTLEYKARLVARSLEESYKDGKVTVLIIDEAHLLRPDALLALKRIFEFEVGFKKLMAIVLVGQQSLAKRLKTDFELTEVSQRVDLYEIGSLNGSLGSYVRHKLERAGCSKDVFEPSAIKEMGDKVDTPLSANNLAAAALIRAHDLGEKHVTGELVRGILGSF